MRGIGWFHPEIAHGRPSGGHDGLPAGVLAGADGAKPCRGGALWEKIERHQWEEHQRGDHRAYGGTSRARPEGGRRRRRPGPCPAAEPPPPAGELLPRAGDDRRRTPREGHELRHRGQADVVRTAITVLLAEGHLLLEDVPGVGKTMLAKTLARSIDCSVRRVQFTPDLLPSDITGVSVFNQDVRDFEFRPGAIFANVVVGDEINRASPKTQSALLECMEEGQVTVDGQTYSLPMPFIVMATQNPIEMEGTYPLPEAQRDRFMARISLGYPSARAEVAMLDTHGQTSPLDSLTPVTDAATITAMVRRARHLHERGHQAVRRRPLGRHPGEQRAAARRLPGATLHCCAPPGLTQRSRAATTSCPTTSRRSPSPSSRTASSRPARPSSRARPPPTSCTTSCDGARPRRRPLTRGGSPCAGSATCSPPGTSVRLSRDHPGPLRPRSRLLRPHPDRRAARHAAPAERGPDAPSRPAVRARPHGPRTGAGRPAVHRHADPGQRRPVHEP